MAGRAPAAGSPTLCPSPRHTPILRAITYGHWPGTLYSPFSSSIFCGRDSLRPGTRKGEEQESRTRRTTRSKASELSPYLVHRNSGRPSPPDPSPAGILADGANLRSSSAGRPGHPRDLLLALGRASALRRRKAWESDTRRRRIERARSVTRFSVHPDPAGLAED